MTDEELMRRALQEAVQSPREVRPNPRVGAALLTREGRLISDHHKFCGGPHAEIEVLNKACAALGGDPSARDLDLSGATMAVTLEPCAHQGRTGPCAEALKRAKVSRVIVGSRDCSKKVNGKGVESLRAAGIEVIEGVLEADCKKLNFEWLKSHAQELPYIKIKMATSLDGLWTAADKNSKWITSEEARNEGHLLREDADVIVTGAGTVRSDNPHLTARPGGVLSRYQPKPYVLSCTQADFSVENTNLKAHPAGAEVVFTPDDKSLKDFFKGLFYKETYRVLVEAGPTLTTRLLEAGLYNEVHVFMAPKLLGGEGLHLGALRGGRLPGLELRFLQSRTLEDGSLCLTYANPESH